MRLDRATRVRNVCGLFIGIVQHTFASGRAHGRVVCLDRATRVRNVKCVWTVHRDCATHICRVGQNHIYMVYIRYFGQGNHQIYGHIRYIYVLANPTHLQAAELMAGWVPIDTADALELLSPAFKNEEVG